MPDDRILNAQPEPDDLQAELSLRPKYLREYIGQNKVKANLEISITAARNRSEPLDHVLLFGAPRLALSEREDSTLSARPSSESLGLSTPADGPPELGRRARGTPRIANRLLRRVRDFAEVRHQGAIDLEIARGALEMLEVDEYG